tara:strand:+ start:70 stop:315 length:246 start_codon:yes stop_codon:yes gene_type:complete
MNKLLVLALTATLIFHTPSQSDSNHFGAGGVFELDLGDSEIPLTPKQEKEQLRFLVKVERSSLPRKVLDGWDQVRFTINNI